MFLFGDPEDSIRMTYSTLISTEKQARERGKASPSTITLRITPGSVHQRLLEPVDDFICALAIRSEPVKSIYSDANAVDRSKWLGPETVPEARIASTLGRRCLISPGKYDD